MGVFRTWVIMSLIIGITALLLNAEGIYLSQTHSVPRKCGHARVRGLIAADCHRMDLRHVPQNLEANIEVLDMSLNRVREVSRESFQRYDGLKFLYLQENILTRIDEGTFVDLTSIEVINLSMNPIHKFPYDVLSLPKLRKLSLDEVELDEDNFDALLHIPSHLSITELSFHKSRLVVLPPLEKFPNVISLNVSGNLLKTFSASQLAPACFLSELDLNGNKDLFQRSPCNCTSVEDWIMKHNITLVPPFRQTCPSMTNYQKEECLNKTREKSEGLYNACKMAFADRQTHAAQLKMWMVIGIVAAVIVVIVSITLFCVHRRCRARRARARQSEVDTTNNLNSETANTKAEAQKTLLDHNNV